MSDEQLGRQATLLIRLARGMGLSTEDAEDCAQETLLAYVRARDRCRYPERWLRRVLFRFAVRFARSRRFDSPLEQDLHDDRVQSVSETTARLDLRRALRTLRPRARQLLVNRYLLELSESEAATRAGLAESSAKQALRRARATLRRALAWPSSTGSKTEG